MRDWIARRQYHETLCGFRGCSDQPNLYRCRNLDPAVIGINIFLPSIPRHTVTIAIRLLITVWDRRVEGLLGQGAAERDDTDSISSGHSTLDKVGWTIDGETTIHTQGECHGLRCQ